MANGIREFALSGAGSILLAVVALLFALGLVLLARKRARSGMPDPVQSPLMPEHESAGTLAEASAKAQARNADIGNPPAPQASASSGIEVAEADPLAEAAVYLEFGYLDQAAKSLRTYVEGSGKDNLEVLRKLLQIYLQLKQIDDYAEILEYMDLAGEEPAYLQEALLAGLGADIDNLHLRVVAESALGLGPERLARLLGADAPLEGDPKAAQADEAPPAVAPAPPNATQARDEDRKHSPRVVSRLIEGGMRLTSTFSMEEKAMLRVFTHPAHEARLHRTEAQMHRNAGNLDAAAEALRRAISAHPRALVNFADLLWILHRRGRLNEYAHTLWRLFAVLEGAGRPLRERFLGMGLALGRHDILEALLQITDPRQIEDVGRRFNLLPADQQEMKPLRLVEAAEQDALDISLAGQAADVLVEANAFLEFGQVDQAIAALESAILDDPADPRLYPTLLDLYDRMDDFERLENLSMNVRRSIQRPPEEIAPMMLALQQRLRLRIQGNRHARDYR